MIYLRRLAVVFACQGLVAVSAAIAAAPWPQFRGSLGSGVGADATPPLKFGPNEAVAWSYELPWSPSSPIVWKDRIFLTTFADGQLETRCLDRAAGKLRWTRAVKPPGVEEFHRSDGSPAASTPVTDGTRVVSYFGSFGLICHDWEGKELWRYPLPVAQSYGHYGSGTSPIIVGNTVLLARDQYQSSSLLALDVKTGAKLWETHRPETNGSFGTPAYWKNQDVDEVVLAASGRLKGYAVKTGIERWGIEGLTGAICTTPIVMEGNLYFAAWSNGVANSSIPPWEEFKKQFDRNGDDVVEFEEIAVERRDYWRGVDANRDGRYTKEDWELRSVANRRNENVMIAVRPGGTGDISDSHVLWKSTRGLPYVPSPLYYDGRIYLVKDGGLLTSLDARTGDPIYVQERLGANGNYYSSPVVAGGHLYLASISGKMTVVKTGGARPEIVHQVEFGSRILATPAVVEDMLLVRTASQLWAFRRG